MPRSCSPTIASNDSSSAISGTRKMVRLAARRTASGSAFGAVGVLPSASDNASAAISTVVASTQRLPADPDLLCGDHQRVHAGSPVAPTRPS
ncbi:MAG: hypothetical protein R3E41_10975 [Burkholderiaceae bacterium]